MKLIYALLALLSIPAFAALPSGVPSVTVSAPGANTGQVTISPSMLSGTGVNGIFSLYVGGSMSAGHFYPLAKNGAAYQVASGESAYCFDITAGASAATSFQLISATASFATGAPSVTGAVFQGGADGNYVNNAGTTVNVVPGVYAFSSSTYPGIEAAGNVSYQVHLDCYEQ